MNFLRTLAAVLFLSISVPTFVMAQCTGGISNGSLNLITTAFQFFSTGVAGEYQTFTAVFGEQYEFSYCTPVGGATSYDTEITILNDSGIFVGVPAGGYNDEGCIAADGSRTVFTPSSAGVYRILTNSVPCLTNATNSTLAYRSVVVVVDIEENNPIESLKISPNPTSGIVRISLDDFQGERLDVSISDVTGRLVVDEQNVNVDGQYTASYDLSTLTKGIYLMTMRAGDYSRTEKIILN